MAGKWGAAPGVGDVGGDGNDVSRRVSFADVLRKLKEEDAEQNEMWRMQQEEKESGRREEQERRQKRKREAAEEKARWVKASKAKAREEQRLGADRRRMQMEDWEEKNRRNAKWLKEMEERSNALALQESQNQLRMKVRRR